MALKNMSLLTTPTSITASGGTALVFADDGVTISNGVHLVVPADADYQTRRSVTAKFKPCTVIPKSGTLSKDKKSISYTQPVVQADGSVQFAVIRLEREVPANMTAAAAKDMNDVGSQLLTDPDVVAFWAFGSTS